MLIESFFDSISKLKINMFTGVPDSLLKPLCDYVMKRYGIGSNHIVAANEGAAVGLAAGHYLATKTPALVYMQNSGIGNAINPICSLLNDKVYAIPALFVIGWRGEPGIHDEPQHIFQGEITLKLFDCLGIKYFVLTKDTTTQELENAIISAKKEFDIGNCYAIIVKKNALENSENIEYSNENKLSRERAVGLIVENSKSSDIFVSTTGKLSRELFEIRENIDKNHKRDFLTVGSMGHSLMIALGIANSKPNRRVFCLDGDGAVLMHLGSVAVLGANKPGNIVHIVANNSAHETVGGVPTVANKIDFINLAKSCGYTFGFSVKTEEELIEVLKRTENLKGPIFIEVKVNLYSRKNLGRPTTTPIDNKNAFMQFLNCED